MLTRLKMTSLSRHVNRAGSFLFNSLKSFVTLSLSSLPLKANPWRTRKRIHFITFIGTYGLDHWPSFPIHHHIEALRNCSSMCFRLLAINICFKSFLPIIKPCRNKSFLHIMFYCQFPLMPYAKYTKNCIFSFQIVSLEKDNQDQADIVLECFPCFS